MTFVVALATLMATGETTAQQERFKYLQGGNIEQVKFVDEDHGFLVADGGRIHYSTNSGLDWEEADTSNAPEAWGNLHGLFFLGEHNTGSFEGWAVGEGGVVLKTTNATGTAWEYVNGSSRITSQLALDVTNFSDCGTHYALLRDIFMVDSFVGVAVGDDGAYATTADGGETWTMHDIQGPFSCSDDPNDIYQVHFFEDSGTNFDDFDKGIIATEYGRIYRTEDAGANWSEEALHKDSGCSPSVVYPPLVVGHAQHGDNLEVWEVTFDDPTDADTAMTAVGGVGNSNGYIFERAPGWGSLSYCGAWTQQRDYDFLDPNQQSHKNVCGLSTLYSVDSLDVNGSSEQQSIVSGYSGHLFTRNSSGESDFATDQCSAVCPSGGCPIGTVWEEHLSADNGTGSGALPYPFGNNAALLGGARVDEHTAVLAGHFGVIKLFHNDPTTPSSDPVSERGTKWAMRIADGEFFSTTTGCVVGQQGSVLRTTNGGEMWTQPTLTWPVDGTISYINAISFSDTGEYGVLVGTGGHIAYSDDYGASWTHTGITLPSPAYAPFAELRDVAFVENTTNTFYAVGNLGRVILSTDGGQTWSDHQITIGGGPRKRMEAVSFAPPPTTTPPTAPSVGYVVSGAGVVYNTTDGGNQWSVMNVTGANGEDLHDVVTWGDGSEAVIVGQLGGVFEKIGANFVTQNLGSVATDALLLDVEALEDGDHLRIGGAGGVVLFRDDGVWSSPRSYTTQDLHKMSFLTEDEGFGLGTRSLILNYGTH